MDAEAVGMMDNYPKASIGNYKGVMLCNRPNEFGQQKKTDANGTQPFKSQVHIKQSLGWNAPGRLLPKVKRGRQINGVLLRHKMFLKDLEAKKAQEREEVKMKLAEEEYRIFMIRENAMKQVEKLGGEKSAAAANKPRHEEMEMEFEEERQTRPDKLTNDNLSQLSKKSGSKKSGKSKGAKKPAWAITEKQ
jgi:hypothetical protein